LRHVTVVEEAHRLLKNVERDTPAAHAVELFAALLAEIRAYGEGLVVAEQIPTKITPDVIKNTALKIVHRLPAREDRDTLGATMNLDDSQSRHVVSLPPGRAAVFADGMDRPMRLQVPLDHTLESPAGAHHDIGIIDHDHHTATAPLTLRELTTAQHVADDPQLTLWIELLIAAHITGKPVPYPDQTWLARLITRHGRARAAAAIIHRVRTGIDNRYHGISGSYQPDELIQHLLTTALGSLDGRRLCENAGIDSSQPETQWQAGAYRWIDVYNKLDDDIEAGKAGHPAHPDTRQWRRRGLELEGTTRAEQLTSLNTRPDTYPDPEAGYDILVVGRGSPPAYVTAVTRLIHHTDSATRFRQACRHLDFGADPQATWAIVALDVRTHLAHPGTTADGGDTT
jgi:hypothetical protein